MYFYIIAIDATLNVSLRGCKGPNCCCNSLLKPNLYRGIIGITHNLYWGIIQLDDNSFLKRKITSSFLPQEDWTQLKCMNQERPEEKWISKRQNSLKTKCISKKVVPMLLAVVGCTGVKRAWGRDWLHITFDYDLDISISVLRPILYDDPFNTKRLEKIKERHVALY